MPASEKVPVARNTGPEMLIRARPANGFRLDRPLPASYLVGYQNEMTCGAFGEEAGICPMSKLTACIREDRVILRLQALKRMEAIRELAMCLEGPGGITDVKGFLSLVMQREKIETTAVGHGVAIPHAHGDCTKSLVMCVGISQQGIDFGAMDGEPVNIMVMIASPARHFQDYLKAVSRVARLLNQEESRQRIRQATTVAEVVDAFKTIDRL